MNFGNENLMKPLLYRDILGPENTPMGAGYGMYGGYMGGVYPTNLLGGVTMQPGLAQDTYQNLQIRKKKDRNFMTNTLLALGAIGAIGLMRFKGNNLLTKITNLFKRTPAATPGGTPPPAAATGSGWWQRLKNMFRRTPTP